MHGYRFDDSYHSYLLYRFYLHTERCPAAGGDVLLRVAILYSPLNAALFQPMYGSPDEEKVQSFVRTRARTRFDYQSHVHVFQRETYYG